MPTKGSDDPRRAAIRGALALRRGEDAGAGAVASATLGLWRDVSSRLAPMIGVRGVDALLVRSLQLSAPAHPWPDQAVEQEGGAEPLAGFASRLEGRDPNAAAEASVALLVAFTDLLASLIGESLTGLLLDPVWAPAPSASAQETRS